MTSIWYACYGSNMCAARLRRYLDSARDHSAPRDSRALWLPGGMYFATRSPVWGGGRAFYDPHLPGRTAARGWLLTTGQFADIAAQEMYREPGTSLDLTEVLATGRATLGPGRYETLLCTGRDDNGTPMLTFTAPWQAHEVPHLAPSAAYLAVISAGLAETHGWDQRQCAAYLADASQPAQLETCVWCGQQITPCPCGIWWCTGVTHLHNRDVGRSHFCYPGDREWIAERLTT